MMLKFMTKGTRRDLQWNTQKTAKSRHIHEPNLRTRLSLLSGVSFKFRFGIETPLDANT